VTDRDDPIREGDGSKIWNQLQGTDPEALVERRYEKIPRDGVFEELAATRVVTKVLERNA